MKALGLHYLGLWAKRLPPLHRAKFDYNYNYNRDLLCAPYKQNDGALHCHDVLTIKAVLNKNSFEASLQSFNRAHRRLQF